MKPSAPTKRDKLIALAGTADYNPQEAQNALALLDAHEVALISKARNALMQATTLGEMRDVHTWATAFRAGAQSRGLGIDAENEAAYIVISAERLMGAELARMARDGERQRQGDTLALNKGVTGSNRGIPTLADLGFDNKVLVGRWQRLALIPDDVFERALKDGAIDADGKPKRLSQVDFLKLAESYRPAPRQWVPPDPAFSPKWSPKPTEPTKPYRAPHVPKAIVPDWPDIWDRAVGTFSALTLELTRGYPRKDDMTAEEWAGIEADINQVGKTLLLFQKKVQSFRKEGSA